jgi:hypothetical protein
VQVAELYGKAAWLIILVSLDVSPCFFSCVRWWRAMVRCH